jgi:Holliday junction resolvase RusA-like endonuclease
VRIPINPVPKPRLTQRDRWKQRPVVLRYHAYCDLLRFEWKNLTSSKEVPEKLALKFNLPMPISWSKRKRDLMRGKPHQQRPDIDNLAKAVMDALCEDDSYVYALKAEKYWSDEGSIDFLEY